MNRSKLKRALTGNSAMAFYMFLFTFLAITYFFGVKLFNEVPNGYITLTVGARVGIPSSVLVSFSGNKLSFYGVLSILSAFNILLLIVTIWYGLDYVNELKQSKSEKIKHIKRKLEFVGRLIFFILPIGGILCIVGSLSSLLT